MLPEVLIVAEENLTVLEENRTSPHFMEWDSQRATRQVDLLQLRQALLSKIIEEIARTDDSLHKKNRDLAALIANPGSPLGSILEAKRDLAELNAYLKGLKFAQSACNHQLYE